MFGPAWHCLTQFDVQADSVLQMVLDLGRYLDNHPIPDHEDIVNIIKEIVGTIVTSVNGKTGEVNLKLSDVTGTDSWPVWILSNAEYGEITDATMLDAYDNDGFRLLYVTAGSDPEKEPAFLMIPGRTFNPDGITRYIFTGGGGSGGGAVQSVNGKVGTVVLTAADVGAATPADVTAVDNKVAAKYGPDNAPPYPVTSVNGATGAITNIAKGSIEHTSAAFRVPNNNNFGLFIAENGAVSSHGNTGGFNSVYSSVTPPPYPVTSVNTKTGAVSLTASDVGAATNASVAAKYGPDNVPPYPVTSVNGKTGEVKIDSLSSEKVTIFPTQESPGLIATNGTVEIRFYNELTEHVPYVRYTNAQGGYSVGALYNTENPPPVIGSNNDTSYFIKSNNIGKPNIYFGEVVATFSGEDVTYRFGVPDVGTIFGVISATFVNANIPVGRCSIIGGNTVSIKPANTDAPGVGSSQNIVYLVFGV